MSAPRHVENDLPPDWEGLQQAEAEAIRRRCAREVEPGLARIVEAVPPAAPRRVRFGGQDPTLYIGLTGLAFGLLHLYERGAKAEHLDLARRYLEAAFDALERSAFPAPEDWLSFHGTGGISAIAAVVHDRLGDREASERHLEDYRRVGARAGDPGFPTEDLLWGRGGFLFGAAFLRDRLGEESVPAPLVTRALEAMIETGRRHAAARANDLEPGPHGRSPLVYFNLNAFLFESFARALLGARSRVGRAAAALAGRAYFLAVDWKMGVTRGCDIGLVHGLSGSLWLMLHFPELLARGDGQIDDVRASLDVVSDCVDAERGLLECLPRVGAEARFTDRVHWCVGTPGLVFLFSRAYRVFGDEAYLETARRAAEHVWRYGLLRKGNGICHGVAGNGYAFLALWRATSDKRDLDRALHFARCTWSARVRSQQRAADRPWSLYEGLMGTLCFYRDCENPDRARFPAFEV